MRNTDRQRFLEIIIGFAEIKGRTLSRPGLELFWNAMQDWSIEDFQTAANRLVSTCEFMPGPKEFEDLRKAGRPTVGEEWATILEAARSGSIPNVSVPALRAVAAIGGLGAIAMSKTDATPFLERRFAEHFAQLQDAVEIREALPQLAAPDAVKRLAAAMGVPPA